MTSITEAEFMDQVTQLAELRGWLWAHFRPAQTSKGWRTPVSGPLGKGWPDLVLVREKDERVMFVELKRAGGRLKLDQDLVLTSLQEAGQDARWWTPGDWDAIEAALR